MLYRLVENTQLTATVWRMKLEGDTSAIKAPGQFVQLTVPGFYLRRPISICDWDDTTITLVYKVVGQGTETMSAMKTGMELDVLNGLGNGFDTSRCGDKPLLIGGGVGLPPMIGLCRQLLAEGKHPTVLASSLAAFSSSRITLCEATILFERRFSSTGSSPSAASLSLRTRSLSSFLVYSSRFLTNPARICDAGTKIV